MNIHISKGFSKIYVVIGVIVVAVIGVIIIGSGKSTSHEFHVVGRSDILQEVSVTGRVKAVQNAELGLDRGGRVAWIAVKVGDVVSGGRSLLAIDNGDLVAAVEQAQATVKKEEAVLAELLRGSRPEEIKVQESEVAGDRVALEDAERGLINVLNDSYTRADDAVRNKIDIMFTNPRSNRPDLSVTSTDDQLANDVENGRYKIEVMLTEWEKQVRTVSTGGSFDAILSASKKNLEDTRLFLEKVGLVVNALTPTSSLTQTTIDSYKADVSTARTNTNTGISNVTTAEEKYRTAASALAVSERQLALDRAGSSSEDIQAQEAALAYAKANVRNAQASLEKTIIRAPFSGTVIKQEARVGEILSASTPVITLISDGRYNIEANLPEADIAKVSVGNSASVSLDAYGTETLFPARITEIEPGETIIDGVPTYKVTFEFVTDDERIKSGMTANIDVTVNTKKDVLVIPQKVIVNKNGSKTVSVFRGGVLEEVVIKTGTRGSGGMIELLDGVDEGESVLIPSAE